MKIKKYDQFVNENIDKNHIDMDFVNDIKKKIPEHPESKPYQPKIHSGMSKFDKLEFKLNDLLPEQGWNITSAGVLAIHDNEEEILKKLYDHGIKYTKIKDHEGCYQLVSEGFLGFGKKKLSNRKNMPDSPEFYKMLDGNKKYTESDLEKADKEYKKATEELNTIDFGSDTYDDKDAQIKKQKYDEASKNYQKIHRALHPEDYKDEGKNGFSGRKTILPNVA